MSAALIIHEPAYDALVQLVCDTVTSPHSKRAYRRALMQFFAWLPPGAVYDRRSVIAWRAEMERREWRPASINLNLAAVRRLAQEAADAGWTDQVSAEAVLRVRGVKKEGIREGHWLDLDAARRLMDMPDKATMSGKRDAALLRLLMGCALRRAEAATLMVDSLRRHDGRLVIVDLIGKRRKVRSVVVPTMAEVDIMAWLDAAAITEGTVLRSVDQVGRIGGPLTASGVWWIVRRYADALGVNIAPHDLRRTAAKLMREGGAKTEAIRDYLGHANSATTEGYIGRLNLRSSPGDLMGV